MNKFDVISPLVSMFIGLAVYIALDNYIYGIGAAIVVLIILSFMYRPILQLFYKKIDRFHELYHFVNTYVISLNVLKSHSGAIENALETISKDGNEELSLINHLTENEKFLYLKKYFRFHLYQLFTDIISIWNEEGGDVIRMSNYVITQLRETEDYIVFSQRTANRRTIEFAILWAFSIMILVVLRFSLNEFYSSFVQQPLFIGGVLGTVGLFLISIWVLVNRITNIRLEGWTNEK